jgi:hypothetical protein
MEYLVTEDFSEAYDLLDDRSAEIVDRAIQRILDEPDSARVRSGALQGDGSRRYDRAWIMRFLVNGTMYHIYWDFEDLNTVILIALVEMP